MLSVRLNVTSKKFAVFKLVSISISKSISLNNFHKYVRTNTQGIQKILRNNETKTCRKVPPRLEKAISLEGKEIAKNINLDDRIECIA